MTNPDGFTVKGLPLFTVYFLNYPLLTRIYQLSYVLLISFDIKSLESLPIMYFIEKHEAVFDGVERNKGSCMYKR